MATCLVCRLNKKLFPNLGGPICPYQLTILSNSKTNSGQVRAQTRDGESWVERETDLAWPEGIVSLSHVAVPIPPDDKICGTAEATESTGLPLGSIRMRGEPAALLISDSVFVRCRHNPPYYYMEDHIVSWIASVIGQQRD